ncbi:MAG: Xaa-Pro peptidase family protein [Streptococcaceae bacterium]|jgi:Xaa-Pro aminopeptidase|nr:Xaa-Pro peptidase family protein [Streptococcaceae bacterium]
MRLTKLKEKLALENLSAFIVTDMKNLFYLTGVFNLEGALFVTTERAILTTDSRYAGLVAPLSADGFEIQITRDYFAPLRELTGRIGFEDTLDFATYQSLSGLTENLVSTSNLMAEIRQFKEPEEIETIRKACQITDEAFSQVLKFIRPGVEEIEVANFLDFKMRELGASGVSFETIVASGKNAAIPHATASHKTIAYGDVVTLDFGCWLNHYASDMTRTLFVGEAPQALTEIYAVVKQANEALSAAAKAGMSLSDYDKIPRDIITAAGYGKNFTHGIGHGVGLDIHEIPYFGTAQKGVLSETMIVTNEPGIYLPDIGGVRIEDDLLITENGAEVLTRSSRELLIL